MGNRKTKRGNRRRKTIRNPQKRRVRKEKRER